ncbi:MAG TPA: hypothetical protein ENJ45_04565, partial [Phaeodactylibacter sp.]|nr:hypothetical protein [Phaeodactylibacter sp.]
MKRIYFTFLFLLFSIFAFAQKSTKTLEADLKAASDSQTKMILSLELAKRYVSKDAKRAIELAKYAHRVAVDKKKYGIAARSAFVLALAYEKKRDKRNVDNWLKSTFTYAKEAGDSGLIIRSIVKRSRLAKRQGNFRKAYNITQEAFDYFSKKGSSISDLEQDFEMMQMQIRKEKKQLQREKQKLENEIRILSEERDALTEEKTELTEKQKELLAANEQAYEEISEKEEALATVEELKSKAEKRAYRHKKKAEKLTGENKKISKQLQVEQMQREVAEMKASRSKLLLILTGVVSLFFVLLAISLYTRFRAKKKANAALEEERRRSDELLLNILPADIAEELKTKGTASAKKYEQVTVLLTDFKDFTKIANKLSPEQLVKELDYCFKAFDHIISHYKIEKIKTI